MSHEDASSLVFVEPQTSDAFQWRGHTVVRTGFPLSHGRVITAQLHQHQLSTGQLTAQMEQVQEKTHKAERETLRQRDEIEEQARLIQELSQRLTEATALPAPTETITARSIASYRTAVPAWSADRNAGGTCRAASSEGGTAAHDATIGTFGSAIGEHREYQFPSGCNLIPGEEALTSRLCQKPTEHTGTASTATGSSAVTYIVPPNPIIMRGGHRSDRVVT